MNINSDAMPRLDKTVMVVETLDTMTNDSTFWASQTPEARLDSNFSAGSIMAMQLQDDFKEFLKLLNVNEVKYLLIGGYAVSYYGSHHTRY